ncbi:MAG: S-layer homology domain-containing protein [Bacillota bacterium]|nr:S-layer homology domain-containing protein [Bacillota bacterium]
MPANKIVEGYSAEQFRPNDLITREQMIKMIYAYVKFKNLNLKENHKELTLSDRDEISSFAKEPMEWQFPKGL